MAKSQKSPVTAFENLAVIRASAQAEVNAELAYLANTEEADAALCGLIQCIAYTPGEAASEDAVADWKAIADAWTSAYAELREVDKLAAGRAWQRLVNRLGVVKPQTGEALRKQAARAATAKADKVNPAGKPAQTDTPPAPLDGKDAAHQVAAMLSSMEAHLIAAIRAGQFSKAATIVADMAKAK